MGNQLLEHISMAYKAMPHRRGWGIGVEKHHLPDTGQLGSRSTAMAESSIACFFHAKPAGLDLISQLVLVVRKSVLPTSVDCPGGETYVGGQSETHYRGPSQVSARRIARGARQDAGVTTRMKPAAWSLPSGEVFGHVAGPMGLPCPEQQPSDEVLDKLFPFGPKPVVRERTVPKSKLYTGYPHAVHVV